jgi:hypothetical protein
VVQAFSLRQKQAESLHHNGGFVGEARLDSSSPKSHATKNLKPS